MEGHFACSCGAKHRQGLPRNKTLNPEAVANRAKADGWRVDAYRRGVTRCPACQAKDRSGEKPNKVVTSMSDKVREATTHERVLIRGLLDKHFDDAAGVYLDGWSDQRIGEEVKVPWAIVTRIREVGYGPILVDPEVAALRAEIRAMEGKLATLSADGALAAKDLAALKARVEALATKRAAAAA